MLQDVLSQLLTPQNCVQTEEGESCSICLQEYHTLCSTSGAVELAIRLPCRHVMGSVCLTSWLKNSNTCPLCRYELYPPEDLKHSADSNNDDAASDSENPDTDDDDASEDEEVTLLREAQDAASGCGYELTHSPEACYLIRAMIARADFTDLDLLNRDGARVAAAACMFVGSSLMFESIPMRDVINTMDFIEEHLLVAVEHVRSHIHRLTDGYWPNELRKEELRALMVLVFRDEMDPWWGHRTR